MIETSIPDCVTCAEARDMQKERNDNILMIHYRPGGKIEHWENPDADTALVYTND